MTKTLAGFGMAAIAMSIAGSALALNPQPLPPRCAPGSHCPGGPPIHCTPPKVAREIKTQTGRRIWKCIKLKVD